MPNPSVNRSNALANFTTNAESASFTITNGRDLSVPGPLINDGDVTIGSSSTLTLNGDYESGENSQLNIEIGGSPESGLFGQLVVAGNATFNSRFNGTLTNGFGPVKDQAYTVATFASQLQDFDIVQLPKVGQRDVFQRETNPNDMTLVVFRDAADLAVERITVPATATVGEPVTISYTVRNQSPTGTADSFIPWTDSVYISEDDVLDENDQLIARIRQPRILFPEESYSETITAPLPGVMEGNARVIVVTSSKGAVPDVNRDNNIRASESDFDVSFPVLVHGEPFEGTIARDQQRFFRVELEAGQQIQLVADYIAPFQATFSVLYEEVPSSVNRGQTSVITRGGQGILTLGGPAGSYYILMQGREGAGDGAPFSLTVRDTILEVRRFDPILGSNAGQVTVNLIGEGFTDNTQVSLISLSGDFAKPAESIYFKSDRHLGAQFDLTDVDLGQYLIRVEDGLNSFTSPDPFNVSSGNPGRLVYNVTSPERIRVLGGGMASIEYRNIGDTDVYVPVVRFESFNASLDVSGPTYLVIPPTLNNRKSDAFLHRPEGEPFQVVPPGGTVFFQFPFQSTSASVGPNILSFILRSPSAVLRENLTDNPPDHIRPEAWDVILDNFFDLVSPNSGGILSGDEGLVRDFSIAIGEAAAYLDQLGEPSTNVDDLLAFLFQQADNSFPGTPLAVSTDAAAPAAGTPLVFTRSFMQPISQRFEIGRFGRGWSHSYEMTMRMEEKHGEKRYFVDGPTGTRYYELPILPPDFENPSPFVNNRRAFSPLGHPGFVLELGRTLIEPDGTTYRFRSDGKLDQIEDPNGNTTTLKYDGNLLVEIEHSNGDRFQLEYNSSGLVSQLIDHAGRTTTYTYDTSGHLMNVAGPDGTIEYSYETQLGSKARHAIRAIQNLDNSEVYYDYDDLGRLIRISGENDSEPLELSYPGNGAVTFTDSNDASTTIFYNNSLQPAMIRDSLGRLVENSYSDLNYLSLVQLPGDIDIDYEVNDLGEVTRITDPSGESIDLDYLYTYVAAALVLQREVLLSGAP